MMMVEGWIDRSIPYLHRMLALALTEVLFAIKEQLTRIHNA